MANEYSRPTAPPAPLFTGEKERNFVKQVSTEVIERVVGQTIIYYPISLEETNFHPLYGEAIKKSFLPPVKVHALVELDEFTTETTELGVDKKVSITVHFHKRRLVEDQNLFVREGDFVLYGDINYEIVSLGEPNQLFAQPDFRYEISAKCIKAREGKFNAM
tara:strand:- start:814 stop:1299 length:486 start_codon:yes stop_codon:yes gene_type:complete